jgi:Heparinase II/III-like protein
VVMANSRVGTKGFGNHKHCDQLAVEVSVGTQPLLVDAGSYVYTSDPGARNAFRGTAVHNTVMIDGQEQHDLNPAWLFRLTQRGTASAIETTSDGATMCARARHSAYARLDPPVVHERTVHLAASGDVRIGDRFDQPANHQLRWQFLLHPAVAPAADGSGIVLSWPGGVAIFAASPPLRFDIVEAWYSPGYGVRQRTHALVAASSDGLRDVELTLRLAPAR